ncbi:unnamed protein product, partial [marine sediment metagenome]
MGAPIRLSYDKDGSVRFGRTNRPVTKVAKPISDTVSLIRSNFVANLQQYAENVASTRKQDYASLVGSSAKAGQPFIAKDEEALAEAVKLQIEEVMRQ